LLLLVFAFLKDEWLAVGCCALGLAVALSGSRTLRRIGRAQEIGKLQSFLAAWAFVVVVLVLLCGAMELWEDGGGRGSLIVATLASVVSIVRTLSIVVLVGVAWAAVRQWSASREGPSVRS
jgi:hypothetical protein